MPPWAILLFTIFSQQPLSILLSLFFCYASFGISPFYYLLTTTITNIIIIIFLLCFLWPLHFLLSHINLYQYYCREGENFVFWFGSQFNSTLNFTQSGWPILFSPDFQSRPPNLVSCQTHFLWLENADQCRRYTGHSSMAMLFSWTMLLSADTSLRL